MTEEELKALTKDVRRKKRIATEFASAVHDLVEDKLWTDYTKLVELSQQTHDACVEWAEASQSLAAAEKS